MKKTWLVNGFCQEILAIMLRFTKKLAFVLKSTPFYIDSLKQTPVGAPVYYETLIFTFPSTSHFVRALNELKYI